MGRAYDPARAMRERLKTLEARERARTEARAVAEGVEETVDLGLARGSAFDKAPLDRAPLDRAPLDRAPLDKNGARRGERETPYRRQAGLEWLTRKGRISALQRATGEIYGVCYRRAGASAHIGSTLEVQPSGGLAAGPSLGMLLKQAAGRKRAEAELSEMRARLFGQSDLVSVCDLVCGQELTPREAGGGEREAQRIEAVLKVALDLLVRR